jgi:tetratricopeptide repeat protein
MERSRALAAEANDELTTSYALRRLGIGYLRSGRLDAARNALEESTRLRRRLDFPAGVAANLVALAYLATEQDRRDDAARLLDDAEVLGTAAQAHAIGNWIIEARTNLSL